MKKKKPVYEGAMMLEYAEYLKIFIALLAVVDPLAALPIVAAMMAREPGLTSNALANRVGFAVTVVLLVALFIGREVLLFFGISVSSFRVSGGILLMLMSISMLQGKVSETVRNQDEARESENAEASAIVPLSIPILAGPGAISTVILYAQRGYGIEHYLWISVAIVSVSFILWAVLRATPFLIRKLSRTSLNVIIRLMGLILLALAVEFIAGGLKGLFPVLEASE